MWRPRGAAVAVSSLACALLLLGTLRPALAETPEEAVAKIIDKPKPKPPKGSFLEDVKVIVGGEKGPARIIFQAPPNDAYILTNFREGTLSLSKLNDHFLTFGLAARNVTPKAVAPQPFKFREVELQRARPESYLASFVNQQSLKAKRDIGLSKESEDDDEPRLMETENGDDEETTDNDKIIISDKTAADDNDFTVDFLELEEIPDAKRPLKYDNTDAANRFKADEKLSYTKMGDVTLHGTLQIASPTPVIRSVAQWALFAYDDFESAESRGNWNQQEHATCGSADIHLGGVCNFATDMPYRKYTGLPAHRFIRIKARYHFIDKWQGEFGYVKFFGSDDDKEGGVMWTKSHRHCNKIFGADCLRVGLSVCGDRLISDQLSTLVEFMVPHTGPSFTLMFGSSLGAGAPDADKTNIACDASFGIDDVQVYIL